MNKMASIEEVQKQLEEAKEQHRKAENKVMSLRGNMGSIWQTWRISCGVTKKGWRHSKLSGRRRRKSLQRKRSIWRWWHSKCNIEVIEWRALLCEMISKSQSGNDFVTWALG